MKFKRHVNTILKREFGDISISKKSITLIEEYLNIFLRHIKEDIIFYDKLSENKVLWKKSRKHIEEIFDTPLGEGNTNKTNKVKVKIFKLKQILLGILPLYILKNSVEYANNILAIYLRHKATKEKENYTLDITPRSRSTDDIFEYNKKPAFNPNKIRKYYKENDVKLVEKSYIFLAAVMEWIVMHIFSKIMENKPERINLDICEKVIDSLNLKSC